MFSQKMWNIITDQLFIHQNSHINRIFLTWKINISNDWNKTDDDFKIYIGIDLSYRKSVII